MFQISANQLDEILSILAQIPTGQGVPANPEKPVAFLFCELLITKSKLEETSVEAKPEEKSGGD